MREINPSMSYPAPVRVLMNALSIPALGPEISDRIAAFEPESLARQPVNKQALVDEFTSLGNEQAARIVSRMPAQKDGTLFPESVDRLLITVHCEMQDSRKSSSTAAESRNYSTRFCRRCARRAWRGPCAWLIWAAALDS